jgi:transcriptional regulator with XRE-family HTH domain
MDRQEYRRRLAGKLRGARAEAGLSQTDVEQATGITTSQLSRFEKGQRAIHLEELLQLAALYDVALERLLGDLVPLSEPPLTTRASANGQRQHQAA